jgi:hypothetical protein
MAAGPYTTVGQSNTYVKDHNATGRMITGFSRNPNEFMLNKYIQVRPVKKDSGYYLQIDQYNASRIANGNIDDYVWTDGKAAPMLNDNALEFRYLDYRTTRRAFTQQLGNKSVEQADWSVDTAQADQLAQKAMTVRTVQAHQALSLAGNWDATNRKDVTTIAGAGQWSGATSVNTFIKKTINAAVRQIMLATNSKVRRKDLHLILNPTTAMLIASTQEIVDHIKQSPFAYSQIKNDESQWSEYGLPDKLYGLPIVVEDATINTAAKGVAPSQSFVMADAIAYILARPGGIMAPTSGPSYSTATLFAYEEMTVESMKDQNNRLTTSRVTDDIVTVLTAPAAGYSLLNLY